MNRIIFAFNETVDLVRYYLRLRLIQARRLLKQTSISVLRIGLGCGFNVAVPVPSCPE
jgi:transcriptional regulator GlxA family with amidase domain